MCDLVLNLQNKCYYDIKYQLINKTSISKIYLTNTDEMITWETKVSKYLQKRNINYLPFDIERESGKITYDINNIISLSECLQTKNINLFLNEIFSFVNRFKTYEFVHGNINLDNLYYDTLKCTFVISDFTNSNYKNQFPKYKQRLFNNREVLFNIPLKYHDLFSLYINLFFFFEKDSKQSEKICIYLYDLLNDYVPLKYINVFLSNFYRIRQEKNTIREIVFNRNSSNWI